MTDRPATLPSGSAVYRTSPGERLTTPWTPGPIAHSGLKSLFGAWRSSIATRLMYADSGGRRPLGQWQEAAGTLRVDEAEASYHLDSAPEPWSVHLEVRLNGTVVEDHLRQAVGIALARHPRARARATMARQRRAGYEWEITCDQVA